MQPLEGNQNVLMLFQVILKSSKRNYNQIMDNEIKFLICCLLIMKYHSEKRKSPLLSLKQFYFVVNIQLRLRSYFQNQFQEQTIYFQNVKSPIFFQFEPTEISQHSLQSNSSKLQSIIRQMGQNECCAEKQLKANTQFNPNQMRRANHSVPKKVALQLLPPIVRKKMQQLPEYSIKNANSIPKGMFSDSYEQTQQPKGYYRGEWQGDSFNGKGQFFFKEGSYYQGCFIMGEAAIEGRYIFNNGCIYEGEIENSEAHGQGTYFDPFQNYEYSGRWEKDKPHGRGRQKFGNGSYYEGQFQNGSKEGYGHYVCQSGVYEGQFSKGNFSGEGTFSYTDGRTYKGEWQDGLLTGYGIFTWPDGNRYQGLYYKGLKHGRGTFFFSNGKIFRGTWLKGLKHGPGELKINNQIIRGVWKQGELETALDQNETPDDHELH